MLSNLYGINDNFDLENAHVLPALLHKVHIAKKNNFQEVLVWGTESHDENFSFVDDLSEACIILMEQSNLSHQIYNIEPSGYYNKEFS